MISKEEVLDLLKSTESYRIERTISTGNMDKFALVLRVAYFIKQF